MDNLTGRLTLSALTLRGVGSYLHGARLDIRPLTILCGKNGSGKSTWFQVLDMLQACNQDGDFPFLGIGGRGSARDVGGHDFTNAYLKDCAFRDPALAERKDDQEKYGPPGTIGLHFVTTESFVLPPVRDLTTYIRSPLSTAQSFLWRGECPKGMHFRLRLAMPTATCRIWEHGLVWDEVIELCINDKYCLEFKALDPYAVDPDEGGAVHEYTLSCTDSFLPIESDGGLDTIPVLRFERQGSVEDDLRELQNCDASRRRMEGTDAARVPSPQFETESDYERYAFPEGVPASDCHFPETFRVLHRKDGIPRGLQTDLLHSAIVRIRQLFEVLASGYFHIGAIRNIRKSELPDVVDRDGTPDVRFPRRRRTRYVGSHGQSALDVWSRFAYSEVRSSMAPRSGFICQEFQDDQIDSGMMNRVVSRVNGPPSSEAARMRRFLETALETAEDSGIPVIEESEAPGDWPPSHQDGPPSEKTPDDEPEKATRSGSAVTFRNLLNRLLRRRDLYRPADWPEPEPFNAAQLKADFDRSFRRYWQLHHEFERRRTLEDEASGTQSYLGALSENNTEAKFLARHSCVLHWAINAGFDTAFGDEETGEWCVKIDGCDQSWEVPGEFAQCTVPDSDADSILGLLWRLLASPSPRAVAVYGSTASWRADMRRLIDNPPENEEARHLSRELSRLLRLLLDGPPPGREARFLIRQGIERLCEEDLARLNRLLLEAVFCEPDSLTGRLPGYVVDTQITYWLKTLLGVGRMPRVFPRLIVPQSLGDQWTGGARQRPTGSPVTVEPKDVTYFDPLLWNVSDRAPVHSLNWVRSEREVFSHPCFGGERMNPVLPERLSAGFHQVAPMVIQAAVMQQNELLAVENPEVHLHPSLQLQVTEFLIGQAKAQKCIAIETHSDLVVRRVIRAMLAEDIPQSAVAIYFTDTEQAEQSYQYSSLRLLSVDDKGRIGNWPEGFMDDDVRESQRLLDIMYGGGSAEGDNE